MTKVLVPLAHGCEELEAVTIIDLLRRARIDVTVAGLGSRLMPVKASRGTNLLPDIPLDEVLDSDFDMVVLPGGLPGADYLNGDKRIVDLVRRLAAADKYTCAICAAPRVLASAGVLEGKRATSYPGTLDKMDIPGMHFTGAAVTVDGKVITGRGPGTAMDFSLALIEALGGTELRKEVEGPLLRG
jgi:4-methyl-5(b-hydroxyethyl)-thiazole monophosphate biosynthesis